MGTSPYFPAIDTTGKNCSDFLFASMDNMGSTLTFFKCQVSVAQLAECSHGTREALGSSPGRATIFFSPVT